jgi:sec-independent protein translocase protein TatB
VFDVGFSELVLCFVVALIVLGPQKLPAVARTLGRWTGRARSYVRNLSAELERESGGTHNAR